MKTRQRFTLVEKEIFQQLNAEEENEDKEDNNEIDEEGFRRELQKYRIARANVRITMEVNENNLEITTYLNRIIRNTYEEMGMDPRMRDTEETGILQNSGNRNMENRNEESGKKLSTGADLLQNYNSPAEQFVVMENRMDEDHSQMNSWTDKPEFFFQQSKFYFLVPLD